MEMKKRYFFSLFLLTNSLLYSSDVLNDEVFEQGEIVKFEKCNKYKWCSIEGTPFYVKGFFFEPQGNGLYRKKSKEKTFLYVKNSDFLKNQSNDIFFKTSEDELEQSEIQNMKINKKYGYTRVSFSNLNKETQEKVLIASVAKEQKVVEQKVVEQKVVEQKVVEQEVVEQQKDLFVYLSLGLSTISSDFDSSSRSISLDEEGLNVDLGVGYRFSDTLFSTLSYQRAMFDEVDIDNLYVSLNYQFSKTPLKPYVGALIGSSHLVWSEYPVSGTLTNDEESNTLLGGLQFGIEYGFSDWNIFGQYQILKNEHNTNVLGDNLSIDFQNNLNLGVRYEF
jgi:hypothetical protein